MKTIAITIEPAMLEVLDGFLKASGKPSRSACVREALAAYLEAERRRQAEAREDAIIRKHAATLNRQARALIEEQAEL